MQVVLEVAKTHNSLAEKFGYAEVTATDMSEEDAADHAQRYPGYGFFFTLADVAPAEIVWVENG